MRSWYDECGTQPFLFEVPEANCGRYGSRKMRSNFTLNDPASVALGRVLLFLEAEMEELWWKEGLGEIRSRRSDATWI
jgi:hypothetical protein